MEHRNSKYVSSLNYDWAVQSSAACQLGGAVLSTAGIDVSGWYPTDVPATVLGVLVDAGVFGDVTRGDAWNDLPGLGPKAENFSNHPMPPDSPFAVPWWFRKEFTVPADTAERLSLQFDGINYRANVWLNGHLIGASADIVGSYRDFEISVGDLVRRGEINTLAIEVLPPQPCDIAITWVDWNPSPPDKNMGLWRDVWLRASGDVAMRDPHVTTRLEGVRRAHLTAATDVVNLSDQSRTATLVVEIASAVLRREVTLLPGERRRVALTSEQYPALAVDDPALWWPRFFGEPTLHDATFSVETHEQLSDAASLRYGIREVTSTLTDDGHALFHVNGEPVQIRGAGWACDIFLRRQPERDLAQLSYVADMNLNTIRFEGALERNELLEWCDENGIMVIAGWCCCDCWEKWDQWRPETHEVAAESLRSQIRRVRRHPCMISWWYGSDFPPPPRVERRYLEVLEEEHWPNPSHSSAANKATPVTGLSGMKMEGPYDYVPPSYWYDDTERGGAFGFATEICPGPAVPPIESLRRMLTTDHLWPMDEVWKLHCGGQEFHNIEAFTDALLARYGDVSGAEELAELSQLATYETQRAMFEAYGRNRYRATGVVQWMLNNAWPSLIWHLYDYYLRPGGGYYGTKKACEPLHVQYSYDDRTVVVLNEHTRAVEGARIDARVFGPDGTEAYHAECTRRLEGRSVTHAMTIPSLTPSSLSFLDLRLSVAGDCKSRNLYWLPAAIDVVDYQASSWINAPIKRFANLRGVRSLPAARVTARARRRGRRLAIRLVNEGEQLAFFVQLRAVTGIDDDVLPVIWSDNYVSLLPGEELTVTLESPTAALPDDVRVELRGLNVSRRMLTPRDAHRRAPEVRRVPIESYR